MVMWCNSKYRLTRRKSNVKYNPKWDGELEQMNRGKVVVHTLHDGMHCHDRTIEL